MTILYFIFIIIFAIGSCYGISLIPDGKGPIKTILYIATAICVIAMLLHGFGVWTEFKNTKVF